MQTTRLVKFNTKDINNSLFWVLFIIMLSNLGGMLI